MSLLCPPCQFDKHEECAKTLCNCTHGADPNGPERPESNGVSHSRVEAYLSCRRKEFYGYGRKLQKIEPATSLALGSAIHKVLEALYSVVLEAGMSKAKQKAAYPLAVENALAMVDHIYEQGFQDSDRRAPLRLIIEKYLQREPFIDNSWREDDDRQWLIMAVEKEFNLEWDPENHSQYPFVIDLIVKDPDGYTIVVDHKGVYDLYRFEDTHLMPQIPKYIGALRALGYKVGNYGVYNMLRTRPDTKAGRPLGEWAYSMPIEVTGVRVQRSFEEQIEASWEVHELDKLDPEERDRRAIRVNNKHVCMFCDFRDLCVEELRGGNVELLLKTEYEPKKKRDRIEVSEEVL